MEPAGGVRPHVADDPWERRRAEASLRIECAGLAEVLARGLDATTVDHVAAAAGISTRTFFRYFRNPRDVLAAVPAREAQRMCRALLARPVDEPLLESFHAWFRDMPVPRAGPEVLQLLEAEALARWSALVLAAPDVMLVESRATRALATELAPVVRARLTSVDDDDVGALSEGFAAVISHVYVRTVACGTDELSTRLDRVFDLLGALHPSPALVPGA